MKSIPEAVEGESTTSGLRIYRVTLILSLSQEANAIFIVQESPVDTRFSGTLAMVTLITRAKTPPMLDMVANLYCLRVYLLYV